MTPMPTSNARVAQTLLPVRLSIWPLRISTTYAQHNKETKSGKSGGSEQINPQASPASPQAQAPRAQCPPVKRTHPAGGCTHRGKE
jgi:hypothetical protein